LNDADKSPPSQMKSYAFMPKKCTAELHHEKRRWNHTQPRCNQWRKGSVSLTCRSSKKKIELFSDFFKKMAGQAKNFTTSPWVRIVKYATGLWHDDCHATGLGDAMVTTN